MDGMNAVAMVSQQVPPLLEEGEDEIDEDGTDNEEDVFFTEADYKMYSWRRTLDIGAIVRCKKHANKPLSLMLQRENTAMKSQNAQNFSVEQSQPVDSLKTTIGKMPSKVPTVSLSSPYPDLEYPDFSRLTVGQHRKFLELQTKFGAKGIRVTTSRDSFEHQQWRQLGAQIYQDQQDFNTFAEFASRRFPENYLVMSAAAVEYMRERLRANLARVETLPRHYTVLQTATLNPGVPLPSDPTLQRIGTPVFTGKIPKVSVPELSENKMFLKKTLSGQELVNVSKNSRELSALSVAAEEDNTQRLAEFHSVDVVLSGSGLLKVVDNHAPHYEQQWEIPVEVKANAESMAKQKVVFLKKPLMKHAYYPHEANAIYHKFALKRILVREMRDRYGQTSEGRDEQEDNSAVTHQDDEFGDSSLWDLETFGTDIKTAGMDGGGKEEADEPMLDQPADREVCDDPLASVGEDCRKDEMNAVSPSLDDTPGLSSVTDSAERDARLDAGIPPKVQNDAPHEELMSTSEKMDAVGDKGRSSPLMEALDAKDNEFSPKGTGPNPGMKSGCAEDVLDIARPLEAIAHNSESNAVDDVAMDTNQGELEQGNKGKVLAVPTPERKTVVRPHSFCESSSDDERRLCIVIDDDRRMSGADVVEMGRAKETAGKCTSEDAQMPSSPTKPGEKTVLQLKAEGQTRYEGTVLQESDPGAALDMDVTDEKTGMDDDGRKEEKMGEHPAGRVATRRSARIRNQSSSEEKSNVDPSETAVKKQHRKKMVSKETVEMKEEEGSLGVKKRGRRRKGRGNNEDENKEEATESKELKKGVPSDGHTDEGNVNLKAGKSKSFRHGEGVTKEANSDVASAKAEQALAQRSDSDTSKNPDLGAAEGATVSPTGNVPKEHSHRLQAKRARLLTKTGPAKTTPPEKQAKKLPTGGNGPMESTIDEIMRLQEKMLSSKQPAATTPSRVEDRGHGDGPAQGQSSLGQGGSGPQMPLTGSQVAGIELREPEEGNCAYSLWKFGRLRLLIKNRVHGLVPTELDTENREQVMSVVSKMERQAELGLEMQTASDLTRIWLNMYLHPGSKVTRGRIDAKTSQILSWESLDSAAVINSQQTINPSMCLKMLYHVLLKLAALPPGRYLLRHRPGDAHVCIYQCMEQAAKNVRSSYDLLAAHQASKVLEAPPPALPWVPLDCNAPYPANRWRGRVPLTFPPRPATLKKQATQQGGKHKKKKKKKKATPANG